jgi:uncharacterized HhH-GPD family protein
VTLHLSQDAEADALLSDNPFALLVGMVLDQQVPLEWAFASPKELERRLGRRLDARDIAHMDPDELVGSFSAKPALHRYPGSMATRVQELAVLVTERYDGKAEAIWAGVSSGAELFKRVKELPGFGEQKSKIFVALLGKQLGVQPDGWHTVSTPFGEPGSFRSVADITDPDTLAKVRAYKQELKAAHKREAAANAPGSNGTKTSIGKRGANKAAGKAVGKTTPKTAAKSAGKSTTTTPSKTAATSARKTAATSARKTASRPAQKKAPARAIPAR